MATDSYDSSNIRVLEGLAFTLGAMGSRQHNFYNQAFQRAGYEGLAQEVQRAYLEGRRAEAAALVPDEMIVKTNMLGTEAMVKDRIRAYRDAVRWLAQPANRAAAQALLMANVPGMSAAIAAQSCEMLLHPQTGFFQDVRLDRTGANAVVALRSRLGEPARVLDRPETYFDERFWRLAMAD